MVDVALDAKVAEGLSPANGISASRITPTIGAEVEGVDLRSDLSTSEIAKIRALLVEHKVLIFRDQDITPAQHVRLAARFGPLEVHPIFKNHPEHPELVILGGGDAKSGKENIFHTDITWREKPSMGSILRCIECPDVGGDTIWTNMAAAYEGLPEFVKEQITGLRATHDILPGFMDRADPAQHEKLRNDFPTQSHPVVRIHPESGEKILFVNEGFVTHINNFAKSTRFNGMTELKMAERQMLDYLFQVAKYPEYQVRVRWRPNTIAFWDNRATQHYAVQDYYPAPRTMMRATIIGDKPF